jgi:RNA polymerase sigma-70 factor (ECF subfamily)
VRNFLRRLARNDVERANDLAQETFIKMHAGLPSYRGAARFSTWLFRIAYHTFLNDERGRRTNVEFSEDQHAGAEDTAAAVATALDVDRALERLPVRQRAVFDLHYKKGMTHSEIAGALALPIGTVKSDLVRGHEKLKEWLGRGGTQ